MRTQEFIEKLRKEIGIPYIDVICQRAHHTVFRYTSGVDATGKEQLYMYSCGKVITVTATLQLVEEGKLSLDDKVCKYLPEIANAFVMNENNEKEVIGEQMTIRHLFTMTAGFTYDLGTPPILELGEKSNGQAVLRDFIPKFVETPLSFMPGSRFQYSLCHDILAAVVEVITKKKFSQYVKEVIFEPLQMNHSCFDNSEEQVADVYMAFDIDKIDKIDEGKLLLPTKAYESGGAGLVSTVEDYIRFADALACGGKAKNGYQVLKEETLRLLASEQVKSMSVNNNFTCVQGDDYGYGLGVRVRQTATKWGLDKGEFGWDGAAGSYVMMDPHNQISVFIGMHLRNWPVVFTGKHLEIVENIYKELFKGQMERIEKFQFNGYEATIMIPQKPNGKWIWKTEFLYAFDQAERALFEMGYTRVYYQISDKYGSPNAIKLMEDFYDFIVSEFKLNRQCILFGFSRGGLYAFNFALKNPDLVEKIYLDAPVLDLKTWPIKGSVEEQQMLMEYGVTEKDFVQFSQSPIDNLKEFFSLKLPLFIVAGAADEIVPFEENAGKLIAYAEKDGAVLTSIIKENGLHHPHSLDNIQPILEFIQNT